MGYICEELRIPNGITTREKACGEKTRLQKTRPVYSVSAYKVYAILVNQDIQLIPHLERYLNFTKRTLFSC